MSERLSTSSRYKRGMPTAMEPRHRASTWQTSAAAQMAMDEFSFQRMHRRPVAEPTPFAELCGERYTTTHGAEYSSHKDPPRVAQPSFTLGQQNDLGTASRYYRVGIDQLRLSRLPLGEHARAWETTSASAHSAARLLPPSVPRAGPAPRLPFSEVGRRFGELDSTGAMPGASGERSLQSEAMAQFTAKPRPPREQPMLTLGTTNDIGSTTRFRKTPALLAGKTHYSLGEQPSNFVTSTMIATQPPPPLRERLGQEAAGVQPKAGPSEVEQRFVKNFNSQDYNIIHGGTRLLGDRNTEATRAQRASEAFVKPFGRKQHPNVNPADRGVSGTRQSFDIITGAERPRERW
ncbi:hypothetical protein AB1Y20_014415 [Prymnesium parvum]|uniref:Uncharacterized protein n=1 Tax=Prymnesium parvum TaxID=97485 RepID=A0AB34IG58_PRYPA